MATTKKQSYFAWLAGLWNKVWGKKGTPSGEENVACASQTATTANPETHGGVPDIPEPTPVHGHATNDTAEQPSASDDSLWYQAYRELEKQDPDHIFKVYDDILSQVYRKSKEMSKLSVSSQQPTLPQDVAIATPAASEGENGTDAHDFLSQYDAGQRRELLSTVASLGLQQMNDKRIALQLWDHKIVLQEAITNTASLIEPIQKLVQDAVTDVPYVASVMAGVSLVLPFVLNPSAADAADVNGFEYVTSQMKYYIEMEPLLLAAQVEASIKAELERQIRDLYKRIIEYEIRSVLHFFKSKLDRYFRGCIFFDDWEGRLSEIQNLEAMVQKRLTSAISGESMKQLTQIKHEAEDMRQSLDRVVGEVQTLLSVAQRMEQLELTREDREYLEALRATDPRLAKKVLQNSKETPLKDSYQWILDDSVFKEWKLNEDQGVLWMSGHPGKGKTMLLCGITDEFMCSRAKNINVSFFFCQETNSGLNNATAVVRGLLFMLVKQQPALMSHIRKSCQEGMGGRQFEGYTAWEAILECFLHVLGDPQLQTTYLIIDALDECVEGRDGLLDLILKSLSFRSVKWLVSSRKDMIWRDFAPKRSGGGPNTPLGKKRIEFQLEKNQDSISKSIKIYIRIAVGRLREQKELADSKVHAIEDYLILNADGTFLWVALVCKALSDPELLVGDLETELKSFPTGLDALYSKMLEKIQNSRNKSLCNNILATLSAVLRPVTLLELNTLLSQPFRDGGIADLERLLVRCGSFLTVENRAISFVHKSARDFLQGREGSEIVASDWPRLHFLIFSTSLEQLTSTLRRDICELNQLGPLAERDSPPNLKPLEPIAYSTVFWVYHFRSFAFAQGFGEYAKKDAANRVYEFIRDKYLYWLEALSLLGGLSSIVRPLKELTEFMDLFGHKNGQSLLQDATRFLTAHKLAIEAAPMQTYVSALLFSPSESLIRKIFRDKNEEPTWLTINRGAEENWEGPVLTFEGHQDRVGCVAFSHDSQRLASGSHDKAIIIWDTNTGDCLKTISNNRGVIELVAFSPTAGNSLQAAGTTSIIMYRIGGAIILEDIARIARQITSSLEQLKYGMQAPVFC